MIPNEAQTNLNTLRIEQKDTSLTLTHSHYSFRLWAANDPVEPSSMKYRPYFHSLPRNAGRNQQHRRRLGQQQQFWADGTINPGAPGGLDPNAGPGLDGTGYQYNTDPRRSTGPSYHYQQTGTQWDREYANFRSKLVPAGSTWLRMELPWEGGMRSKTRECEKDTHLISAF